MFTENDALKIKLFCLTKAMALYIQRKRFARMNVNFVCYCLVKLCICNAVFSLIQDLNYTGMKFPPEIEHYTTGFNPLLTLQILI